MQAIQAVLSGQRAYCKFLAANDTGLTGGHQAGIYIAKPSIPILFDEPCIKGTNKEKWVNVKWQDGVETDTRFIYYGKGTRNEYRITNFGRGFPFLRPEYTGALFVVAKCDVEDYQAFVLNSEEDIDQFLDAFGISPTETNQLIDAGRVQEETQERIAIQEFIAGLKKCPQQLVTFRTVYMTILNLSAQILTVKSSTGQIRSMHFFVRLNTHDMGMP